MINNKKTIKILLLVLAIVLVIGGTSYAFYNILIEGRKQHQILTDGLTFSYTDTSEGITMNTNPMSDKEGLEDGGEFTFSVSAELDGNDSVYYMVYVAPSLLSTVDNKYAKVALFDSNDNLLKEPEAVANLPRYEEENNAYVVYADKFELTKNVKQTREYKLKFWLSNDLVDTNVSYKDEGNSHIASAGDAEYSFSVGVATGRLGESLSRLIMNQGVVASGNGLYVSTDTNDGKPTYYYRGAVENNYVQLGETLGGSCEYNGNLVFDFATISAADKKSCLATTGMCDASAVGYPHFIGVDANTCTMGFGGTYIEDAPQWNEEVCNYNSQTIVKYTGDGTNLLAAPVSENECSSITTLCDARSEGLGFVSNFPDAMCNGNMIPITLEKAPTFGKVKIPKLWRVVRINEDETIRLVSNSSITQTYNPTSGTYASYYSNTNVENGMMWGLNNWYNENLMDYDSQIATSTFCEQAKVSDYEATIGNVTMADIHQGYTPTFKCVDDANGYGLVTGQKIGLLSLDEAIYSGGAKTDGNTYIRETRTMSPHSSSYVWNVTSSSLYNSGIDSFDYMSLPVISLKSDVYATGIGTLDSPWKIQK